MGGRATAAYSRGVISVQPLTAVSAEPVTVDDLAAFMAAIEDSFRKARDARTASLDELRRNGFGGVVAEFKLRNGRFVLVDFAVRTSHAGTP